ncbi:hypothetical protein CUMW_052620 [Citrus unshiu]|nr:hypothetical protein CUMW_052620 [Citrus unshiu]
MASIRLVTYYFLAKYGHKSTLYLSKRGTSLERSLGPSFDIPLASSLSRCSSPCQCATYCFSLQRLGIGFVILVMGLLAIAIAYAAEVRRMHPEDIQSLRTTIFTSGIGVRNFLNSFLVTMKEMGRTVGLVTNLNDFHLDYYYGLLIAVSTLNLGAFSLG